MTLKEHEADKITIERRVVEAIADFVSGVVNPDAFDDPWDLAKFITTQLRSGAWKECS